MQNVQKVATQGAAALALVLAMYMISLAALRRDQMVEVSQPPKQTQALVIVGDVLTSASEGLVFVTSEAAHRFNLAAPYRPLSQSMNRTLGAQFTYSFWMKVEAGEYERTVLLRGDPTRASFAAGGDPSAAATVRHPVAFCPMIRVRVKSSGDVQVIAHVNTSAELNQKLVKTVPNGSPFDMREYQLVTVSFEDGKAYGAVGGTSCSVWVNQDTERRQIPGEVLRENEGNLYVFPVFDKDDEAGVRVLPVDSEARAGKVTIRNLSYHNYAFNADDVFNKLRSEANASGRPYVHEQPTAVETTTRSFTDLALQVHT
jgi:hypothetical protein